MREPDIAIGFTELERDRVGDLYWEAFGKKLGVAFVNDATGAQATRAAMRPDRVLVARLDGAVAGVCGFYADGSGAAAFTWKGLLEILPFWQAIWASLALSVLARSERNGVLVLDGICVDPTLRGSGIGSALLGKATDYARERRLTAVRLSVIDDNPRAEALYRRRGFKSAGSGTIGWLRHLYGFNSYRVMEQKVK